MRRFARIGVLGIACGAAVAVAGQDGLVTGTITYRERMALSPSAVVDVRLEDVTRPGSTPPIVSRGRIERPGPVPVAFRLTYEPQAIDPAGRYAVRATITDGGVVLFTSTDTTLVLTQGHAARADLVLTRVAAAAPPAPAVAAPAPQAPPPPNPLPNLPATFVGTVPCADCEGIRYHLNLFADDSFVVRMTYLGRSAEPFDDLGSWALSSDRQVLVLQGRGDGPELFAITARGALRKLDAEGRPIDSRLPYELTRASSFRATDIRSPMRGMYTYMADAGAFVECSTGRRWAVATEAANADLERAYASARPAPGAAVLAEVLGVVTERPAMEGAGRQATLVVEQVGAVKPRESCGARFTGAPLVQTEWRLVRLGDRVVPPAADRRREPSLRFEPPADGMPGSYSGSTGCNRVIGTYTAGNAALALTGGGTLMACKDEAGLEAPFLAALKNTRTYRITGRALELMDGTGARLARFEARVAAGITR